MSWLSKQLRSIERRVIRPIVKPAAVAAATLFGSPAAGAAVATALYAPRLAQHAGTPTAPVTYSYPAPPTPPPSGTATAPVSGTSLYYGQPVGLPGPVAPAPLSVEAPSVPRYSEGISQDKLLLYLGGGIILAILLTRR